LIKPLIRIAVIIFLLNLFFVSIDLLGAFKATGTEFGENLIKSLASMPILGLLLGIIITTIVQSSSATTSLVVGLAATGLFGTEMIQALKIAIPILMGANIGTSVTNTLVSIGHIGNKSEFERAFSSATVHDFFNILAVIALLPLQVATNFIGHTSRFFTNIFENVGGLKAVSPLKIIVKPQSHLIKELCKFDFFDTALLFTIAIFLFLLVFKNIIIRSIENKKTTALFFLIAAALGVIFSIHDTYPWVFTNHMIAQMVLALFLLFTALISLVKIVRSAVLTKVEALLHKYVFKTPLRAFFLGIVITATIQSSSATTSIIIPLCGAGILTIYQIFPYTLGANIGTTITAILAALATGSPIPISMAFAHLFFNVYGIILWYPLRFVPINVARFFGRVAMNYRFVPFIFIIFVFYLLPALLIYLFR
jgi:sodium-dependent phosphate cotransporter